VRNVLPPGANGLSNLVELGAFETTGARPAHNDDQLGLYAGLLRAPRPFTEGTLDTLFKSADFGVPPGGAASTEHPRPDVARCRAALGASLADAIRVDPATLYKDKVCGQAGRDGEQARYDAIWHRPLGGITQPLIPWQNRPTFQQVVEFAGAAR
jgi:hypothetical protein